MHTLTTSRLVGFGLQLFFVVGEADNALRKNVSTCARVKSKSLVIIKNKSLALTLTEIQSEQNTER